MSTLFMIKLGARPKGRLIEQHDIFFGIAEKVSDLIPAINEHWSEVENEWHIDAYRAVTKIGAYRIAWDVSARAQQNDEDTLKLFFINLGGYLPDEFEEYHHKMLIVANSEREAMKVAKESEFYHKFTFKDDAIPFSAASHIDDRMQVDVDEIYNVSQLLEQKGELSQSGRLIITPICEGEMVEEDKQMIGYLGLKKLEKLGL